MCLIGLIRFPKSNGKGAKLTMLEWMKETYLGLLADGWTLDQIDSMDIFYYLDLLSYEANKKVIKQSNALDDAGL